MGATINLTEMEAADAGVQFRIKHPEPVLLGPVANGVNALFDKIFDSEGSYAGNAWAPLAPSTMAKKARMGYPDVILVEKGDLRTSLVDPRGLTTTSLSSYGSGYVEMRDEQTLAVGSDDEAGFFHQGGTRFMPARPIAPDADAIPSFDIDAWTELVANFILGDVF